MGMEFMTYTQDNCSLEDIKGRRYGGNRRGGKRK